MAKSTTHAIEHEALAVVLQVRRGELQVLLWERGRAPYEGDWALPGGLVGARETLEASIQRHLAAKVDVRELSHLEQLETLSDPRRHPERRQSPQSLWPEAQAAIVLGLNYGPDEDPLAMLERRTCGAIPRNRTAW